MRFMFVEACGADYRAMSSSATREDNEEFEHMIVSCLCVPEKTSLQLWLWSHMTMKLGKCCGLVEHAHEREKAISWEEYETLHLRVFYNAVERHVSVRTRVVQQGHSFGDGNTPYSAGDIQP